MTNRELLGKGLEHIALESSSKNQILKIPRLDWIFAQQLLGINAAERTEQNIRYFQKYFRGYALPTTVRTVQALKIPMTNNYVFDHRQIIAQEKMHDYVPLEGTFENLDFYLPQLKSIAKNNCRLYNDTGYSLDLFSSEHLIPTIVKFISNENYWGFPNLFTKNGRIKIPDFGLFQLKNPTNIIDEIALLNLGTLTRSMGNRIGVKFLPD